MKIGLALSGGGIRGIAHAGVLKALEENDIKIDIIGGTSSGGIISSLYAMGYSPYYIYILFKRYAKEIVEINSNTIISSVANFMMNKKINIAGLKTGESLEKAYDNLGLKKGIRKVKDINRLPVVIPAVNVVDGEKYIFTNNIPKDIKDNSKYIDDIPIGRAIRATSSFPGIFCPCSFEEYNFLDGGVLDNVPVLEVKNQGADKVIAINFKSDDVDENSNVMDIIMRTLDIMGNKISAKSLEKSDLILTIPTDGTGLFDVEKLDNCYKSGYKVALENMDKIKMTLNLK